MIITTTFLVLLGPVLKCAQSSAQRCEHNTVNHITPADYQHIFDIASPDVTSEYHLNCFMRCLKGRRAFRVAVYDPLVWACSCLERYVDPVDEGVNTIEVYVLDLNRAGMY